MVGLIACSKSVCPLKVSFVDMADVNNVAANIQPNTKVWKKMETTSSKYVPCYYTVMNVHLFSDDLVGDTN